MLSYLDRFVSVVQSPSDVMRIFADLSIGQQHHLNRAMRAWFNYLEITCQASGDFLNALRRAIPKDQIGIDVKIPVESQIVSDLSRFSDVPLKYRAVYDLLLDSGLRLVEAVKLIADVKDVEEINSFVRCPMGMFRRSKQSYYAYFTTYTLREVRLIKEEVGERAASKFFQNKKFTAPKYLRKFAFNKMVELGIPESVADFIEGRVATRIGARHYMALMRQADKFYAKYAEYVISLRDKAGLKVLS